MYSAENISMLILQVTCYDQNLDSEFNNLTGVWLLRLWIEILYWSMHIYFFPWKRKNPHLYGFVAEISVPWHCQVWVGNPAKFLRKLTEEEIAFIAQSATNYINLAQVHAAENAKSFDEIELEKMLRKKYAHKDEEYDSMLGVVREIPPQLILPDNILPHNAQKAVARWTFSQPMLGVVACCLGAFWHAFVLCFFMKPNKIGSSTVLGSTAHNTTSILNCNGQEAQGLIYSSLTSLCGALVIEDRALFSVLFQTACRLLGSVAFALLHRYSFGPSYNARFMFKALL